MYGLRIRTYSMSLGTAFDWFVPDQDMPSAPNPRGYDIFQDVLETPHGNSFQYDKGKRKSWELEFEDIQEVSKNRLEHCCFGWLGSRQITMVYFGTSVIGTTESPGSMATAGQLWGTGYILMNGHPKESGLDMWNVSITIKQYGPDQVFV